MTSGFVEGTPAADGFTGSTSCASCHQQQYQDWKGSHHELAMQDATEDTVLGNFNDAEFMHSGIISRFFRKDGKFLVNTEGKDGKFQDFEVKYTFGVMPLQQYLVEFPDGRVQTLGSAWDSRPAEQGGQRWFHIYPDEHIDHEDELHWTGTLQNWNFMCADCHSTNLKKNYSSASDTFKTTWSEISVGCEACHGPGSQHIEWAGLGKVDRSKDTTRGLAVELNEKDGVHWAMDKASGISQRSEPNGNRKEIEVCASCHSRRGIIQEGSAVDASFLDHYLPALLTEGLYHADGQIRDEVYVWGSFTQSKMFSAGVTCSDCHEPHSQKLKAPGDGVCVQCHLPSKFATTQHHHHESGSPGANCLNCHMPETPYMVVDPRRDHSMRIPRPDHSVEFGTPNACQQCHVDKENGWLAEQFSNWYPNPKPPFQNWTETLTRVQNRDPAMGPELTTLIQDTGVPDIARATAVFELQNYLDQQTGPTLQAALQDESPLVRMAALRNLDAIAPQSRLPLAGPLLQDDFLAVRTEAARVLSGTPTGQMNQAGTDLLTSVQAEYVATQQLHADRVESQVNLGNFYLRQGDPVQSERHLRKGLKLDPKFTPAYINLADLYRGQGMNQQSTRVLGEGITNNPDSAALYHAMGLALVRQGQNSDAIGALKKAVDLDPETARFAYVLGVALNSTGSTEAGITALEKAHDRHPGNTDILNALATINRDAGRNDIAIAWAQKLLLLNPADTGAQQLLKSLNR